MNNIFLFGAGASSGSGGLNYQIPLGDGLYQALRQNFPNTWGKLPTELAIVFNEKFENGMQIIWEKYSNNISVLMQDMAVFFSKIAISNPNENLYVKLIRALKEKNLLSESILSTLNYDCLLELATIPNQISVSYSSGEIQNSLLVWKLHGSCNFILDGIKATRSTQYMAGATFNGTGLKIIQINEIEPYCRGDNSLYPAMSIFMKGKPNQIGRTHVEGMQETWKGWISKTKRIFVIGVNPYLDDAHIWDPLSNAESQIYFCGNKDAFTAWQKAKSRNDIYLGDRFQHCFSDILAKIYA